MVDINTKVLICLSAVSLVTALKVKAEDMSLPCCNFGDLHSNIILRGVSGK